MTQADKAQRFRSLHVKGDPVILYNVWDAGSAKAVVEAGAKAVATGSWSVAGAQGFADGEAIPLELVEMIVARIAATVDVPVSVDFEGGYAAEPDAVAENVARIVKAGAIGVNFEDRIVGGEGRYDIGQQSARVAAIRAIGETLGVPLVINARTDAFLQAPPEVGHEAVMGEAKERAAAYAEAGADCFFAPWLIDEALVADLCQASPIPVNIMMKDGAPPAERLAMLGVSRVSHGPGPFRAAMDSLKTAARVVFSTQI